MKVKREPFHCFSWKLIAATYLYKSGFPNKENVSQELNHLSNILNYICISKQSATRRTFCEFKLLLAFFVGKKLSQNLFPFNIQLFILARKFQHVWHFFNCSTIFAKNRQLLIFELLTRKKSCVSHHQYVLMRIKFSEKLGKQARKTVKTKWKMNQLDLSS